MTRYHATRNGQVPFTQAEEDEWDAAEAAEMEVKIPKNVQLWALKEAIDYKQELSTNPIASLHANITSAINSEMNNNLQIKLNSRWNRDNKKLIKHESEFTAWAVSNVTNVTQDVVDELFYMASLIQKGEDVDTETWVWPIP